MPTAAHAAFIPGGGMNTVNKLWEQVIDFENIYHAYRAVSRGKRYRQESLDFKYALEDNLCTIINELIGICTSPLRCGSFGLQTPKSG
jgi:hypothetical protein